ncbi:Fe-S cluster assembly protein SufD [Homoserinimonas sp. A520]
MSVSITPTQHHGPKSHQDPKLNHSRLSSKQNSAGGEGLIPVQSRAERFHSYDVAEFEPVTGGEIQWKYTPLKAVRPLLDDALDGSPTELDFQLTAGATIEWVDRADARIGRGGAPEERASANAWSNFDQALAITISGDEPAQATVKRSALGSTARAAHTVIVAKPNSHGLVVLENSGGALLSENLEIVVENDANLTVVSVQQWDQDAVHVASHFATLGNGARLKHVVVSLGGAVVRVNPSTQLVGAGADAELYGLYFADAGQFIEHQVFVNHDAPQTRSRVSYKGALHGDGAHTVWIGDVLITPKGTGTDSYEQNRNLLLSDGARADSVPNLEIETGDIAGAGHATTSGRFDDEQLFYLQARGIPELEARRLVVRGFLSEIVQKVGVPELEQRLEEAIEAELAAS